jgi:triphosphatase
VVNSCLAQILPNASEVAAGSEAPEHVHQLRVGLRRLRTALRELKDLAPPPCTEDDAQALDDAFGRLGAARDRQVVGSHITARLQAAGAPWAEWPQGDEAITAPADTVRSAAFQRALIALSGHTYCALQTSDDGASPVEQIAERLRHLHRQITKAAGRFEKLPIDDQHRVRKRLKRLRYLAEFASPLYRRRAVEQYLRALKPAQDALGEHNDEAVAEAAYNRFAHDEPRAWFAVGWLLGQREQSARRCGKALRAIAEAKPFWQRRGGKRR